MKARIAGLLYMDDKLDYSFISLRRVCSTASNCTFASLKYQMLGSVISMQAWLRLSPYTFVVLNL